MEIIRQHPLVGNRRDPSHSRPYPPGIGVCSSNRTRNCADYDRCDEENNRNLLGEIDAIEMLLAGESGVTPIDRFDASKFPTRFSGQIRAFHAEGYIDGKSDRRLDDYLRYCIVAGKKALERADLDGERPDKMNADRIA
ncbi:hypothetical protein SASPL_114909 [Salvia splendens]|uniref:beta-ketoacyl-[acyl-carrier-protein] synthase I n=1 Tax=Salvia splendens TaxID=180675 RepID=A0A8X8Y1I5_SALSN|nr:hypothetical protein SASPL_114909 [Salvia splendens]